MIFECPKCKAVPHKHGKGGSDACKNRLGSCDGFICECDSEEIPESDDDDHGSSFSNPCESATCGHCGWSGTVPVKPAGLSPWEKKALEAGWTPPEARAKELGIT
jgi:hypothetical protein